MPIGAGTAQGYLDNRQQGLNQEYLRMMMASMQQAQQQRQRQEAARAAAGPILMALAQRQGGGGAPGGMPQIAPPPASLAPDRGPMPPQPGQASVATPAPAQAPQQVPYRALPEPPAGEGDGVPMPDAGDGIPPPPGEPAAPQAAAPADLGTAVAQPRPVAQPQGDQLNVRGFISAMKQQGVNPELAVDMLEAVAPRLNEQSQMDLKMLTIENQAIKIARDYAQKEVEALRREKADAVRARDVDSKIADRTERNRIREADLERKLRQHVGGGTDALKRTEFEKDGDGNIIGVTGVTKSGRIVKLDMDGKERAPGGAPASPKADTNRLRQINSWRQELNTLSNLQLTSPTPERATRIKDLEGKLRTADAPAPKPGGAPAPAAAGGVPARPAGVPPGSAYSPSRKQWKAPDGRLFTETGAPVA